MGIGITGVNHCYRGRNKSIGLDMKAIDVICQLIEERRMNQREPRLHDRGYLIWLRKRPCCICGKPAPSDACHIRFASEAYGKRPVGLGEKPDDKWAIPMCRECHTLQHSMNEREFYRERRILPLYLAAKLYAEYGGDGGKVRKKQRAKPIKTTRGDLWEIGTKRTFPKTQRKLKSRGFK